MITAPKADLAARRGRLERFGLSRWRFSRDRRTRLDHADVATFFAGVPSLLALRGTSPVTFHGEASSTNAAKKNVPIESIKRATG
jgi:hypothetical protein